MYFDTIHNWYGIYSHMYVHTYVHTKVVYTVQ